MHPALNISEITENILSKLDDATYLNRDNATLAALARTSTVFMEPALNRLWYSLVDINQLLKCLPVDALDCFPDIYDEIQIELTRELVPADWDRVLRYAHRVKSVHLDYQMNFRSFSVLETISDAFPSNSLFPNVTHFSWSPEPDLGVFQYMRPLLGPHLNWVELTLSPSELAEVPDLPIPFSALEILRINFDHHSFESINDLQGLDEEVWFSLSQIPRVLSVTLPTPDLDTIALFANLVSIKTLSVTGLENLCYDSDSDEEENAANRDLPDKALSSIPTVAFGGADYEQGVNVLKLFPQWAVESFSFSITKLNAKPALASTRGMYGAVASRLSQESLKHLRLGISREFRPSARPVPPTPAELANLAVPGSDLRVLFCFSGLTTVNINTPIGFQLDDPMIWELAQAWPHLTELELGTGSNFIGMPGPPPATLDALRAFALFCPKLNMLIQTLELDATRHGINPAAPKIKRRIVPLKALTRWSVVRSPIRATDPLNVALFLFNLFPELEDIRPLRPWHSWLRDVPRTPEDEEEYVRADAWMRIRRCIERIAAEALRRY
ncbi:F-box domain-containing protein [Mycena kentingensis (nom. inval.)]|nr:F-box domain-containing protein [Mycena kentingensis (nom. inval.)]